MKVSEIKDAIMPAVVARKCFIVDVTVSSDNDVVLTIESEEGSVVMDDCVELSRSFEELFNREEEDYSLTVTSAGLDQPFKVMRQYEKAIGSRVEVSLKGGQRFQALLKGVDESGITLEHKVVRKIEGSKKKETVMLTETFPMDQVNAVRPYIEF